MHITELGKFVVNEDLANYELLFDVHHIKLKIICMMYDT